MAKIGTWQMITNLQYIIFGQVNLEEHYDRNLSSFQ